MVQLPERRDIRDNRMDAAEREEILQYWNIINGEE